MLGKTLTNIKKSNKNAPFPPNHDFNELLNGPKLEFEQEIVDITGKRVYSHCIVSPVVLNVQKKGILVFNIDISERKLFEKALQESERKFRNIFNNSTDGIIIHDYDGNIYDYNNEFRSISSRSDRDLLTSVNFFDLCLPDHREALVRGVHDLVNTDSVFEYEMEIVDSVGISFPVEIKCRMIEYLGSYSILTIVRNIAFRKRFEIRLLNTVVETEERERERLAGDLHDEIGPLLSSMKMYLSLLKDTSEESKKQYISSQVMDLVKQAITSIREVSNSLSPHILTN
jgi:PAS domain S-box-containing protein